MKNIFIITMVASSVLSLTACATTGSEFSCPAPKTGMCKSVHQVDKMVSTGVLGKDSDDMSSQTVNPWNNFESSYPSMIADESPLRTQDKVMKIWIASYQDSSGDYHYPSTVLTVIQKGGWSSNPVKSIGEV